MEKTDLEKKLTKIYKSLKKGDIDIEELAKYKGEFSEYYKNVRDAIIILTSMNEFDFSKFLSGEITMRELFSFDPIPLKDRNLPNFSVTSKVLGKYLEMCNDYYVNSKSGDILITDSEYDECMEFYTKITNNPRITTSSYESKSSTKWDIIKHTNPNMVGSLDKVYTFEELAKFIRVAWDSSSSLSYLIMAPKFDGTSTSLTVVDGEITMALTRKDGYAGQNIIDVIRGCSNYKKLQELAKTIETSRGSIKCEILCATKDFEELKKEAQYSNRRSAVAGIINTPSNLKYSKYISVEPLLVNHDDKKYDYVPNDACFVYPEDIGFDMKRHDFTSPKALERKVTELLDKFKSSDYPYRVDGVVIYVPSKDLSLYKDDAMKTSIAYKVNTSFGITEVIEGYMSIGRTGIATPMIHVAPCDVNETIVEDVSLSNLKKAEKFNLHEGDRIIIESSGDVIPMIKEVMKRNKNGRKIVFDDMCPFCGSRFRQISDAMIGCVNPNCIKLKAGKIINFLDKMGVNGISDETIFQLVDLRKIDQIKDVFELTESSLNKIDGWGDQKAQNFVNSINEIRNKPKSEAEFIGALGISGISKKKAEAICKVFTLEKLCELSRNNKRTVIENKLLDEDGFGIKSIKPIIEFFSDKCYEIEELSKLFNLVAYQPSIGEVVFTNFRDSNMEDAFKKIGYSIGNSVNKNTKFVICPDPNSTNSSKIKMARQKNIKIIGISEAEEFLNRH